MSTSTYPACCDKDNGSALGSNATLSSAISADGTPIPGELYTVPARCGCAVRLRKGQIIRIINTPGSQVCDTWLFNSDDLSEFSSMEHTRAYIDKIIPKEGDALVTNQRRPIGTLLTDEDYRLYYGRHAVEVLHQNQGALQRLLQLLEPHLPQRNH